MKNKAEKRHDSLIERIEQELIERNFKSIYKNTTYSEHSCGEIDLWAKRDKYILIFEMKTTYSQKSRKKAIEQLNRAKDNCFPYNRVFKFYVSNYRNPKIEWIKQI